MIAFSASNRFKHQNELDIVAKNLAWTTANAAWNVGGTGLAEKVLQRANQLVDNFCTTFRNTAIVISPNRVQNNMETVADDAKWAIIYPWLDKYNSGADAGAAYNLDYDHELPLMPQLSNVIPQCIMKLQIL